MAMYNLLYHIFRKNHMFREKSCTKLPAFSILSSTFLLISFYNVDNQTLLRYNKLVMYVQYELK